MKYAAPAVILALLGVVTYQSISHSSELSTYAENNEYLNFKINQLAKKQDMTHESLMLETSTRQDEIASLKPEETDESTAVMNGIDLFNKSKWVVYYRNGYCVKSVFDTEAEAQAEYKKVNKDYAKIIFHNNKVIAKFGGDQWTNNCIQDARQNLRIHNIHHEQKHLMQEADKHHTDLVTQYNDIEANKAAIKKASYASQIMEVHVDANGQYIKNIQKLDRQMNSLIMSEFKDISEEIASLKSAQASTKTQVIDNMAQNQKEFLNVKTDLQDAVKGADKTTAEIQMIKKDQMINLQTQNKLDDAYDSEFKTIQYKLTTANTYIQQLHTKLNAYKKEMSVDVDTFTTADKSLYIAQKKLQAMDARNAQRIDVLDQNVAQLQPGNDRP